MNWHDTFIPGEWTAEGTSDDGWYRAAVYYGVLPDAWKADVEFWTADAYYKATRRHGDVVTAKIWCEAALLQLRRIAEQLGELKT